MVGRLEEALGARRGKAMSGAHVLIVGLAYKRNVADVRESPTFKLIELLEARGASVAFHDPHVAEIPRRLAGTPATPAAARWSWICARLEGADAVLIATDHDAVDYDLIGAHARLIVDTRNAFARRGIVCAALVKA